MICWMTLKSWVNFSKASVIDKHPKYFAHFTKAIGSLEYFNSLTFTIDYLIPSDAEVPENISSIGEIPGVLKVGGTGEYMYIVSNNFEHGRKCGIDFTQDLIKYTYFDILHHTPFPHTNHQVLFRKMKKF